MKIGDLAQQSGLSVYTLRYYEQIGLLPPPSRDRSGHRQYDAAVLAWIGFLARLKSTGMPLRQMVRYARLRQQGAGTEAERQQILEEHRDRVRVHLEQMQDCLAVLDHKIDLYAGRSPDTAQDRLP